MNNPTMSSGRISEHCRVIITDKCNLSCSYCCMQIPGVSESFTDATAWYIAQQMHRDVIVSGGEPLLVLSRIAMFTGVVRYFNPDVNIYVYTNGIELSPYNAKFLKDCGVKGLTVSPHSPDWPKFSKYIFSLIHGTILPIRLRVQDVLVDEKLKEYVKTNDMELIVWTMNDCLEMEPENRYRLKDPEIRWR